MLRAHLHAHHPRVTIRVGEINIPGDKNILIIRVTCRENHHTENCDFDDAQDSANHRPIPNPRFKMRNPKFYLNSRLSGLVTRICYASMHKQSGPVAQRLEQGTHNPLVPGSNPGGPSPESFRGCYAGAERRRTRYARPDSWALQDYGFGRSFNFRFSICDLRLSMLCNESHTSVWLLSRLRR